MQKEFVKTLKWKNLSEYHDLYLKSDALLLAVLENYRKICLKKPEVKWELLTDIDM